MFEHWISNLDITALDNFNNFTVCEKPDFNTTFALRKNPREVHLLDHLSCCFSQLKEQSFSR